MALVEPGQLRPSARRVAAITIVERADRRSVTPACSLDTASNQGVLATRRAALYIAARFAYAPGRRRKRLESTPGGRKSASADGPRLSTTITSAGG